MGTTQSVISRLEEGGGARNRIDTLARVATALSRHLVVSFPEKVPANLQDAVQVGSEPLSSGPASRLEMSAACQRDFHPPVPTGTYETNARTGENLR